MQEYYDRSMELLQGSIRAELFAAARPILAKEDDEASSYFAPGSRVKNSLVADGCTIEGSVENCILFPGVTVEKGAELRDSILFKGTRGARRRDAPLRHHRQICGGPARAHAHGA